MTLIHLRHADILQNGAVAQVSRVMLNRKRPQKLHDHDFYELLWVQNGRVRHVSPDSRSELTEGDMIFLQPHHSHALQGKGEAAMVVSVTLHPELIKEIGKDFPALNDHLFWATSPTPVIVQRDSMQLAAINRAALVFEQSAADKLATTAFLLPLLTALVNETGLAAAAPDWLWHACVAARNPEVSRNGAAGLVAQTGKAHAHVTRTLKRYSGETPASYINAIRMHHAARALTGGQDPLAEIAAEIGIPNLSHFHKQFRAFHGISPAQYRTAKQRDVVQPE